MPVGDFEGRAQVVAIRHAGPDTALEHPPASESIVGVGDSVYLIGQYDDLLQLLQQS
jgi:hypothetical protein